MATMLLDEAKTGAQWRAMAKAEGHRAKLPPDKGPKPVGRYPPGSRIHNEAIPSKMLGKGWMTVREVADAIDTESTASVRSALMGLRHNGAVERREVDREMGGRVMLWRLVEGDRK